MQIYQTEMDDLMVSIARIGHIVSENLRDIEFENSQLAKKVRAYERKPKTCVRSTQTTEPKKRPSRSVPTKVPQAVPSKISHSISSSHLLKSSSSKVLKENPPAQKGKKNFFAKVF